MGEHYKPPFQGPAINFIRGDVTDGVHFAKDAAGLGDAFYLMDVGQVWITNKPDGTPPNLDDIFKVLAFSAKSYSGAIGAEPGPIAGIEEKVAAKLGGYHDLQTLFHAPIPQKAVMHVYHSGQFRSYLAKRRAFWAQFVTDLNMPYNQPRP